MIDLKFAESVWTVYKITNLSNQRFYFGIHKTKEPYDSYLGSGVLIRRAVKKYGIANFKKEVLAIYTTHAEACEKEIALIETAIQDPSCYNLAPGGEAGWEYVNAKGFVKEDWKVNYESRVAAIKKAVKKKWQDPTYREKQLQIIADLTKDGGYTKGHLEQWKSMSQEKRRKREERRKTTLSSWTEERKHAYRETRKKASRTDREGIHKSLLEDSLSYKEIGEKFGVAEVTVARLAAEFGISRKHCRKHVVSDATKKLISTNLKGKTLGRKGKIVSEETRLKLSNSHKGRKVSAETYAKIVHNNRHRSPATRAKLSQSLKGHTTSEETKRKISESVKRYYQRKNNENDTDPGVS